MCDCSAHNTFLTAKGLEEAAQRERLRLLECRHVDDDPGIRYLDKVGSVSALDGDGDPWVDELIEEQYRRFHNGW